ncbi:MAG TPA: hypothetical protein VJG90_02550 [Candidatus Nanoarchaeia archaeon]|nr:hypothetical protein [Candidatus Nanoarchaeia archaeon]
MPNPPKISLKPKGCLTGCAASLLGITLAGAAYLIAFHGMSQTVYDGPLRLSDGKNYSKIKYEESLPSVFPPGIRNQATFQLPPEKATEYLFGAAQVVLIDNDQQNELSWKDQPTPSNATVEIIVIGDETIRCYKTADNTLDEQRKNALCQQATSLYNAARQGITDTLRQQHLKQQNDLERKLKGG